LILDSLNLHHEIHLKHDYISSVSIKSDITAEIENISLALSSTFYTPHLVITPRNHKRQQLSEYGSCYTMLLSCNIHTSPSYINTSPAYSHSKFRIVVSCVLSEVAMLILSNPRFMCVHPVATEDNPSPPANTNII
jgi:hypothetical protein